MFKSKELSTKEEEGKEENKEYHIFKEVFFFIAIFYASLGLILLCR